ncbi:hypothetical protein EZ449_11560 [Pedobacter frigidisoli]|uniref:Uncharacterized protein n=1 Tax=Pedobacter frigidisoli TaxID=2530455 RepID=A0A4R0P3W7_9SPHI|nr:hypothetical protein [Pedobacter frigidisoli]TCD08478.1 hypothetical protein EZ449_11560 [Pedobacter frigidisoli]
MTAENLPEDSLGSSPEENLRIENELLKLKMQAELGAKTHVVSGDLPPEMENMFLKNIMAFHQQSSEHKLITIFRKLKSPEFKPAEDLDDETLSNELIKLENLLMSENIQLSYSSEYPDRTKYKFITEEFFELEIDDVELPGMMNFFDYEEFHPNHKNDINARAESFITAWFDKNITDESWELADNFIFPDKRVVEKKALVNQIQNIFNLSIEFVDGKFEIFDISFDLIDDEKGMGYAEGFASYTAVLSGGENQPIRGSFKIYFSLENGWWEIVYFVFPGFEY